MDGIKLLRKDKKLSQKGLADLLGISQPAISQVENGAKMPSEWVPILKKHFGDISRYKFDFDSAPESVPLAYNNKYYPNIVASAGLDFLTDSNGHESIPISLPNITADGFINVFGDSMYPKYCSGEIIGLKRIDKELLHFGHAYAVQMSDGEVYLKYIMPGKDDEHWVLESENEAYPPREFHLKYIDKVFMIKAVISKKSIT